MNLKAVKIMASVESLNTIKKDVISNLSKDKLKQYVFYLTKRYYETYIESDEKAFNNVIEQLYEVTDKYRETYVNLLGFTFFCLHLNANIVLTKQCSNNSFKLTNPFTYDLLEDDNYDEELSHDIKNIFNKERVKERYYEKRASEFIK